MIFIFDLGSGTNDQIKHFPIILYFCKKYNVQFSIRYSTCRPIETVWKSYDFTNLFNEKMFENNKEYVSYHSIEKYITSENSYDYRENKWKHINDSNERTDELIKLVRSSYQYIIVGCGIWYWYNDENKPKWLFDVINKQLLLKWNDNNIEETLLLIPSDKIMNKYELFKNRIGNNTKYNIIHYRYEDDWNYEFKRRGLKYIVPTIDDLIEHVNFKEKMPIYIATSNIELLYNKKLMNFPLDSYKEIIYKKDCNDLMFDEAGLLDLLIAANAEEIYGVSFSGFSIHINKMKRTNNYYDKLEIFNHEKYYKKY